MRGRLFTEDFLREGVRESAAWSSITAQSLDEAKNKLATLFKDFNVAGDPNEQNTKDRLIYPVLEMLGWPERLPEERLDRTGRKDVPDGILFIDKQRRAEAERQQSPERRYALGSAVFEAKRWRVMLDRRGGSEEAPSSQILRYLSRAEVMSDRAISWGILSNGRHWRLYFQGAKSRAEEFLDIDLPVLLGVPGVQPDLDAPARPEWDHWLKVFLLFFSRDAFERREDGKTFHQIAIAEGRYWETKVREDLSETVFEEVFPGLIRALHAADPKAPAAPGEDYLSELRDAAFTFLYRTLFALYAEDRNLLPRNDEAYDDYGLDKRVRQEIARRIDGGDALSDRRTDHFDRVAALFRTIDEGDASIGVPPYNGGLFSRDRSALLNRARLTDAAFSPLFDRLSRIEKDGRMLRINYRDLTVRQLGAIYERLLEHQPVWEGGEIKVRLNAFARKGSGSYYTPDDLVDLIIERTVGPMVDRALAAFVEKCAALRADKRSKETRRAALAAADPAEKILSLRVCDPAMGSGHFLVALIDYLSDKALEAMAVAASEGAFADYVSPVAASIEGIRARILARSAAEGWRVREDQLEDRMIVRRMALKRCVYGVDKNPMAVELAKVALWLHSFTVGAPLSFLDHHLRCGDSLFGEWVRPLLDDLHKRGDFFADTFVRQAKQTVTGMSLIEGLTDADIAEAGRSAASFAAITEETATLRALLDVRHATRWLGADGEAAWKALMEGQFGDPMSALMLARLAPEKLKGTRGPASEDTDLHKAIQERRKKTATAPFDPARLKATLAAAKRLADEERFFHWQVAFPGVWENWESAANDGRGHGGFDAVIGNPPWDRMKMQEVEWFAARKPEIALAQRAADRKTMIATLKKSGDPLHADYEKAQDRAEAAMALARSGGQYPLLSQGDINIYSLFVERAQALIGAGGAAGLLVPSGIASDKTASTFFKSVATVGRVHCLFDFENRRGDGREAFFPDVDSRFKFAAFVVGGSKNTSAQSFCGFFLRDPPDDADAETIFALTPADFALVNPNTGTAPIFRSKRDAEITKAIYRRLPVLADRSKGEVKLAWPVKYFTMFHMTNDSGKFWTRAMLEKAGAYPAEGNRWRKGKEEFLPLYEGKMVQAFDHRAANVVINPANLNRPAQEEPIDADLKSNPELLPTPQYWIASAEIAVELSGGWAIAFKDVTATTNARTMIASVIPRSGVGNTLPLMVPHTAAPSAILACNQVACLNSLIYDYLCRQKVHGQHLNSFIVEQVPVVSDAQYDRKASKAARWLNDHVLRLTYTAHDMAPFARDLGYDGPPFVWDETERLHLRARLDALYFILYGVTDRDDVRHIMSSFPIVREKDMAAHGFYLTQELILAYMNALEAGDAKTVIDVKALRPRSH